MYKKINIYGVRAKFLVRSVFILGVSAVIVSLAVFGSFQARQTASAATQTNAEVFYKRSVDGGVTFGDFYNISNDADPSSIAHVAAEGGMVYVLWDHEPQPREAYLRRSPDGGVSFGMTFNVSSNNGDSSESDLIASGNTLHTVWEEDYLTPDGNPDPCCSGDEAFYRRSGDTGITFGNAFDVSNTPGAHSRDPDVAASGNLVGMVYEDPTPGSDNIFFNRSTSDGLIWSSYLNVSNGAGAEPSIAISGSNVHVVWQSGRYNRSVDGGATFAGAVNLPSGFGTGPQVAAVGNTVHVIGCGGSGGSVNYVRSLDNGQTWGGVVSLGSGCKKPTIAASGNGVYVVWENNSTAAEVYFRRSMDGGSSFDPALNISNNDGSSSEPSVAVDATTGYVYVVWYDNTFPTPPAPPVANPGPQAPVANAGPDQILSDSDGDGSIAVTLDGSGSFDSDGIILSYEWKEGATIVGLTEMVNLNLAFGTHDLTLTVQDNDGQTDADIVRVLVNPNQAPVANAGQDQTVFDSDGNGQEQVTLNASGSTDDGTIVSYEWKEGATVLGTTLILNANFNIGTHMVTLKVTDNAGLFSTDDVLITVNSAPSAILYLSPGTNGIVGGINAGDEDILAFDGVNYSMHFDGSDVGVGNLSLGAFDILPDGSILMSFTDPATIPGISGTVDDSDIVRFVPTALGDVTAGNFEFYFDGSDVGLSTNAEDLDAIAKLSDGRLLFSTTGDPSVSGAASAKDEDVLAFTPTSLGLTTSGSYLMYFDGSDVGLSNSSNEDVDALAVDVSGALYLSTFGAFTANGLSGQGEDVFKFVPTSLGDATSGTYQTPLFLDGSNFGLSFVKVSGIDIP